MPGHAMSPTAVPRKPNWKPMFAVPSGSASPYGCGLPS